MELLCYLACWVYFSSGSCKANHATEVIVKVLLCQSNCFSQFLLLFTDNRKTTIPFTGFLCKSVSLI